MCEITIICLANSRKPPAGRCVAGKRFKDNKSNEWIRPVSTRPGHEVSDEERRYENDDRAQLLDIVSIPVIKPNPTGHQVENYILNPKYYWSKIGIASWKQIKAAVDPYDLAFWSDSQSTFHGHNDKVPEVSRLSAIIYALI